MPTPPAELIPDRIAAEPGSYGNIYYNKLTWSFPEFEPGSPYDLETIWYEIYTESLTVPNTWYLIGTNMGRDNVFYHTAVSTEVELADMMLPNTEYTYRVRVNSSDGPSPGYSPEVSCTSPNFPKIISSGMGTNGWQLKCGLKIYDGDDSGRPEISAIGVATSLIPVASGPRNPTSASTVEVGGGGIVWVGFNNIFSEDGSRASSALATSPLYLVTKIKKSGGTFSGTSFQDTLTTVATYYTAGGNSEDWGLGLTPADVNSVGFSAGVYVYDSTVSPEPRYSEFLVASGFGFNINSAATILGVKVETKAHRTSNTAYVDHIRVTVYYTLSAVIDFADPVLEMSESGGAWVKIQDCDDSGDPDSGNCTGTITPMNSTIYFDTDYRIRMTTRDSNGYILNTTNEVNITTYSLDWTSFPNMLPNSGLQYGFYDNVLAPPDTAIETNPAAVGTYKRYGTAGDAEDVSIIVTTPTSVSLIPSGTSTIDFYSKKALKLIKEYDNWLTGNLVYTMNLSGFKFPGHPLLPTKLGFTCRLVENLDPSISLGQTNGCRARISRMTGNITDSSELVLIPPDNTRENDDIFNTVAGHTGERGHIVAAVFTEPTDTLDGTHHQSQIQFKAIRYSYSEPPIGLQPNVVEVYIGDMMLFDLSRIFGGNGADIIDTTEEITNSMFKKLMKAIDNWWDFDYENNTPDIPYEITVLGPYGSHVATGTVITCELYSVEDDNGGMDTTGYLPTNNYSLEYNKTGDSFFDEKGPLDTSDNPIFNAVIGTEDLNSDYRLDAGATYKIVYMYTNSGGYTGVSTATVVETAPYPDKVRGLELLRYWDNNTTRSYFTINWTPIDQIDVSTFGNEYAVQGYKIQFSLDRVNWSYSTILPSGVSTDTWNLSYYVIDAAVHYIRPYINISGNTDYNSLVYFCRICAYSRLGDGPYSEIVSSVSVSLPSAPQYPSYYFTDVTGDSTKVIYQWGNPEDDGDTITGTDGAIGFVLMHGKDLSSLTIENLGPQYMRDTTYRLNIGESAYFKVAAITDFTTNVEANLGGIYTDLKKVTFMTYTETVKIRGTARTEGYIDFYFTARTGDGTYVQLTDGSGQPSFWRLTSNGAPISAGADIYSIQALLAQPNTNIFRNGITIGGEVSNGWPTSPSGPIYSVTVEPTYDIFGESIKVKFTMVPYLDTTQPNFNYRNIYNWDVQTTTTAPEDSESSIGLDGIGAFLVVTDYTTDISFYSKNTSAVRPDVDFMTTYNVGSLIWTVNSSIVYNPYLNKSENTPLTSKEFYIPVRPYDTLATLEDLIMNGGDGVDSLEDQMNEYFLGSDIDPAIKTIYEDADQNRPFIISVETGTYGSDREHLKVNIQTIVEGIQNQVTCRTANLKSFYLATRANVYYLNDMMYELRSFEDMYGRNKPGSTSVPSTGYIKRSYGFKFNLDYIREYQEDENSSLDITPIPGMSSSNSIGLDVMGTTRTITITGVRVDNSNYWMFHAPYEYIDSFTNQITQGGVIYMGTSNWGWCKFMKAVMGTFQFVDGPYRLIMMSIPSSLMQQYVPDRYCKYQYPDGTYIVQAGTEDMCYVMIERFTTSKNDEMFNAIDYSLILKRVVPLGSST